MEMGKRRGNISLWRPSVCPAVVRDRLYCPWDGRPLAPQLLLGVTGAQKAQPLRRRSLNMVGLLRAPSSGKVLGEGGFRGGGGGIVILCPLGKRAAWDRRRVGMAAGSNRLAVAPPACEEPRAALGRESGVSVRREGGRSLPPQPAGRGEESARSASAQLSHCPPPTTRGCSTPH